VPQLEALCELVCVAKQGSAAEIGDRLRRIGARLRADSSDREVVLAAVLQDGRALHRLDVLDADNLDAGHLDIRLRAERRPEVPEEHGVSRLAVAVRRVAEPLCRLERVQPPRLPGVPELSDSKRSGSPSSLSKHSAYAPPVPCFCAREADTPEAVMRSFTIPPVRKGGGGKGVRGAPPPPPLPPQSQLPPPPQTGGGAWTRTWSEAPPSAHSVHSTPATRGRVASERGGVASLPAAPQAPLASAPQAHRMRHGREVGRPARGAGAAAWSPGRLHHARVRGGRREMGVRARALSRQRVLARAADLLIHSGRGRGVNTERLPNRST